MVSLTEILEIYIIRFWVQSFGFVPFCILNNLTVQSRCVKMVMVRYVFNSEESSNG